MKSVVVRVVNFEKYKGRGDVKNNSWFRCSNRILEDHEFFDFTHEEMLVWIYLLAISSQKNACSVCISYKHANVIARLSFDAMDSAISKLSKIKMIEVETLRGRNVRGTSASRSRALQTNRQTNKQDITDITGQAEAAAPSAGVHEKLQSDFLKDFVSRVPIKAQDAWFETYPEKDWVAHQIREAVAWIHSNPGRGPKSDFAKFFTSWLRRNWEWQRKGFKPGNEKNAVESLIQKIQKAEAV